MAQKKKKKSPPIQTKLQLPAPDYAPPVDVLLTAGDARAAAWLGYRALGLSESDVPELIRMVDDERCYAAEGDAVWAPVHARRALGQLRAVEAIPCLLALFEEDSDWILEDMPRIFTYFGEAAIEDLGEVLHAPFIDEWARVAAASCLVKIAQKHPATKERCLEHLRRELERFESNPETVNSNLIGDLVDLNDSDSLPLIKRVFDSGRVDEWMDSWDMVRTELGLPPQSKSFEEFAANFAKGQVSTLPPPRSWELPRFLAPQKPKPSP
jgi:hypothetical protein